MEKDKANRKIRKNETIKDGDKSRASNGRDMGRRRKSFCGPEHVMGCGVFWARHAQFFRFLSETLLFDDQIAVPGTQSGGARVNPDHANWGTIMQLTNVHPFRGLLRKHWNTRGRKQHQREKKGH